MLLWQIWFVFDQLDCGLSNTEKNRIVAKKILKRYYGQTPYQRIVINQRLDLNRKNSSFTYNKQKKKLGTKLANVVFRCLSFLVQICSNQFCIQMLSKKRFCLERMHSLMLHKKNMVLVWDFFLPPIALYIYLRFSMWCP